MSELEFLSPYRAKAGADFRPVLRSPLARALRQEEGTVDIRDISLDYGKIEVRGEVDAIDIGAEVVKITPERALVLCPYDEVAALHAELCERVPTVVDVTGALAGLQVQGATLMRRLTDLDLDDLPAAGAVAHVPAVVLRAGDEFRIFFPQEHGHYLAEVVIDAAEGLP